jgi:Helix-turn-helix domain
MAFTGLWQVVLDMSTHMSKLSHPTECWLTKQRAAQILQVAEKTIDRMAKSGKIQKELLKRPGQAPIVVFHPGDIERFKPVVPAPFVMSDTVSSQSGIVAVGQVSTPMSKVSKVRLPLWLTLQEAVDYSGLPEAILREFIAGGRIPALDVGRGRRGGRWRIRKVDLREMSPFPLETLHQVPAHADQL